MFQIQRTKNYLIFEKNQGHVFIIFTIIISTRPQHLTINGLSQPLCSAHKNSVNHLYAKQKSRFNLRTRNHNLFSPVDVAPFGFCRL